EQMDDWVVRQLEEEKHREVERRRNEGLELIAGVDYLPADPAAFDSPDELRHTLAAGLWQEYQAKAREQWRTD
ncbi:hypothetical protein HDU93_004764, partial [Gonapodya sp. JEL0774]